jgi:hypothetical protein
LGYSYFATNKLTEPIEITLEAQSQNMWWSTCQTKITKRVEPASTEFMMHTRIATNQNDFTPRSVKASYKELNKS